VAHKGRWALPVSDEAALIGPFVELVAAHAIFDYRKTFAEEKDKGFRAGGCEDEYAQIVNAYRTLIQPHVDPEIAQQTCGSAWPPARR